MEVVPELIQRSAATGRRIRERLQLTALGESASNAVDTIKGISPGKIAEDTAAFVRTVRGMPPKAIVFMVGQAAQTAARLWNGY